MWSQHLSLICLYSGKWKAWVSNFPLDPQSNWDEVWLGSGFSWPIWGSRVKSRGQHTVLAHGTGVYLPNQWPHMDCDFSFQVYEHYRGSQTVWKSSYRFHEPSRGPIGQQPWEGRKGARLSQTRLLLNATFSTGEFWACQPPGKAAKLRDTWAMPIFPGIRAAGLREQESPDCR